RHGGDYRAFRLLAEQGDNLGRAVTRHKRLWRESGHLAYVPLVHLRIVRIVSEYLAQVVAYHFKQLCRREMKIHGYAEVQQLALVYIAVLNRKVRWVVRAHVE